MKETKMDASNPLTTAVYNPQLYNPQQYGKLMQQSNTAIEPTANTDRSSDKRPGYSNENRGRNVNMVV